MLPVSLVVVIVVSCDVYCIFLAYLFRKICCQQRTSRSPSEARPLTAVDDTIERGQLQQVEAEV